MAGKKGQLALVMLLMLVAIILLGLAKLYADSSAARQPQDASILNQQALATKALVNSCLEQSLLEARRQYGDDKQLIEAHVNNYLPLCVGRPDASGVYFEAGIPASTVIVTDDSAAASLDYPITLGLGASRHELRQFSYFLNAKRDATLPVSGGGLTLLSPDSQAEFRFSGDVAATLAGQPVSQVAVKLTSRTANGMVNTPVLGNFVYDALPDGAGFSRPVTITIRYEPDMLPPGYDEDTLAIAYYDRNLDAWRSLESVVDKAARKVTAQAPHFTTFAIVKSCSGGNDQSINLGWIYKEPCYEIIEGELSGTLFYNCPRWFVKTGQGVIEPENAGSVGHGAEDGPIYAPQGREVKRAGEGNALPQHGEPNRICEKKDWDSNPSTPDTYGYEKVKDIGGKGSFEFTIRQVRGTACFPDSSNVKLDVVCDDSCVIRTAAGKTFEPQQTNTITQENTFLIPFSEMKRAGSPNRFELTVKNEHQPCSSAEGTLSLPGTGGMARECPESTAADEYLVQSCKCGGKAVTVIYDEEKARAIQDFAELSVKEQPSTAERATLRAAVAKGKEQYCFRRQLSVAGRPEFEILLSHNYKEDFDRLVSERFVKECCTAADIYPDKSNKMGRENCEALVCSKSGNYYWTYTGIEITDSGKKENREKCAGDSEKAVFLAKGCGVVTAAASGGGGGGLTGPTVTAGQSEVQLVKTFAAKYGVDLRTALQVAMQESGIRQHNADGSLVMGDGGCSYGVMQIYTCQKGHPECIGAISYRPGGGMCTGAESCNGKDVRDTACNIEAGIRLLKSCYDGGQSNPKPECTCGRYYGWDYALRCYNGCVCGNGYVEMVRRQNPSAYMT
ncbi:hypothetical protein HYY74_06175 [Candidatus Woesearchaeota archaeon]|nr:hypothetical protein [Candidatus Woesearchaeota archaeon]